MTHGPGMGARPPYTIYYFVRLSTHNDILRIVWLRSGGGLGDAICYLFVVIWHYVFNFWRDFFEILALFVITLRLSLAA